MIEDEALVRYSDNVFREPLSNPSVIFDEEMSKIELFSNDMVLLLGKDGNAYIYDLFRAKLFKLEYRPTRVYGFYALKGKNNIAFISAWTNTNSMDMIILNENSAKVKHVSAEAIWQFSEGSLEKDGSI